MEIKRSINELERLGFKFHPIGSRLNYEFSGKDPAGLPAARVRQLLQELGGCVPEVVEHLRTRHRPPARWIHPQVTRLVERWPREVWPIKLYRQGEEVIFADIKAVKRRTMPGEIWTQDDEILLSLKYSRNLVNRIKDLRPGARRWDPERRVWAIRQESRHELDSILLDHYGVSLAEALGELKRKEHNDVER